MVNVKDKFSILKDTPNVLHMSESEIKSKTVNNGVILMSNVINMLSKNIEHFTKKYVLNQITEKNQHEIVVLHMESYPLHVSYNEPTQQMVINLAPFNVDTITIMSPDPRNIYATLAYAMCFRNIVTGRSKKIKESYFSIYSTFLTSMFVQLLGREYGLLGKYATQINLLKFITSVYVLTSFFGVAQNKTYSDAGKVSMIDYKKYVTELNKYDLTKIDDYIKILSDLKILPGITKYHLISRVYRYLSVAFLPALEDLGRYTSIFMTSSIPGTNIIPRFIEKYNEDIYADIINISKLAF